MADISQALARAVQHHQAGRLQAAEDLYRQILTAAPHHAETHNNLGIALQDRGQLDAAIACYRRALELQPELADAHNNLGLALQQQGQLDEALACFRRALELAPGFVPALLNLGNVHRDEADLDRALPCYRRAMQLAPDLPRAHSYLIYALHFATGPLAAQLPEELRRWNARFAAPLAAEVRPHANDRAPERRLRIGYVSPDFRWHPVGRFLLPLLEAHDHERYEIVCYASQYQADGITQRCRAAADAWRDVVGLSDAHLAQQVRDDRIDILVDLSMHLPRSRLLVFARKPAPVQITYLAYCGTTGMAAIDYRLTDPHLDPPGGAAADDVEQGLYLDSYWCYQPLIDTPPVAGLPALAAGHVTFACLNDSCKISPATLAVWGRLLAAVPDARLLLHVRQGSHRQRVLQALGRSGIAPQRIAFAGRLPMHEYLRLYQHIDVGLDPFPYGGGTTTCDALWMGVPVVSLAGRTGVGRGGLSILSQLGLQELLADDVGAYVRIAAALADDRTRLAALRATLRPRMLHSPLMDAPRFARRVEAVFREAWQQWCAR